MKSTLLLYHPGAENKKPLGETKKLVRVRSNLEMKNIGPVRPSMSKEGKIDMQWACGRSVASGSVNKHNEYIPHLLERSEFDIIAVPVRTNDKMKGGRSRRREHHLRLYIWGMEHGQLATNEHVTCYN